MKRWFGRTGRHQGAIVKRWLVQFVSTAEDLWAVLVPGSADDIRALLTWMDAINKIDGLRMPDGCSFEPNTITTSFPGDVRRVADMKAAAELAGVDLETSSLPDKGWIALVLPTEVDWLGDNALSEEFSILRGGFAVVTFCEGKYSEGEEDVLLSCQTLKELLPDALEELAAIKEV